jgi:hypothetical protein
LEKSKEKEGGPEPMYRAEFFASQPNFPHPTWSALHMPWAATVVAGVWVPLCQTLAPHHCHVGPMGRSPSLLVHVHIRGLPLCLVGPFRQKPCHRHLNRMVPQPELSSAEFAATDPPQSRADLGVGLAMDVPIPGYKSMATTSPSPTFL